MKYIADRDYAEIAETFNALNGDTSHYASNDDICTDMACVKTMLDYIPRDFWKKSPKILDPCCGNGNFGAYCAQKTNMNNIYFNEFSQARYDNCKTLLNPPHLRKGDFFTISEDWNIKWDLIMANPPYSGGANKNRALFLQFITSSIDLLNDKGYLCFIVPNSWMTYNNNNVTLHRLLNEGSFLVIDNDAKKYFNGVGSSFVIFVWQKGVFGNKTKVVNTFLKKDVQEDIVFPKDLPFIPLYISQEIITLIGKLVDTENRSSWDYRCDLHNFTQKKFLRDEKSAEFPYETIHTARKTRWACKKQGDIYDKYLVITPLSTYFIPYIRHNVNVTQSVGYIACDTEEEAENVKKDITQDFFKVLIHVTRYGNFNNIMVLKHLRFGQTITLTDAEKTKVAELAALIRY